MSDQRRPLREELDDLIYMFIERAGKNPDKAVNLTLAMKNCVEARERLHGTDSDASKVMQAGLAEVRELVRLQKAAENAPRLVAAEGASQAESGPPGSEAPPSD